MAEMTADLAMWMLNFSETEAVIICAAVCATMGLLAHVGVRLVQVMVLGEEPDEDD